MSIAELKKLIRPPTQRFEVGTLSQWREYEDKLGTRLPCDYLEFVLTYGSGLFARFYRVYNPFADSEYTSLIPSVDRICGYNRQSQKSYPERFPYPYYPEAGGLLPWGNDENGNDYFWLTEGEPDKWVVVQDENRGNGIQVYRNTMTGFLLAILQRKIEALAGGYPNKDDFVFEPWGTSIE